ncbi:DUF4238 domain-containing protein [Microvirga sp. HBU67558]|uniref:DUF4238 domain-containing protein n=1 Tax=Microvirga TaxID=186650 RepID=UPI001B380A0C|nr:MULTISPECIES: DUF4238 domain-containing protein [unclassified Microvirga]MBQ0821643.1 DUF4238 domain-containing protein [Microvirga sp. HBU67558]
MPEARRHHFVSQCYLKGFTSDGTKDGQLFVVNVADGSTFSTRPINVAVERDFNAVEGRPAGELEGKLAKLESFLGASLDRVVSAKSIENYDDWWAVLNLIAMFSVRNPRFRNTVGDFIADLSQKMMSLALATPERWASQVAAMKAAGVFGEDRKEVAYEDLKRFHESGKYDIKVSRGYRIALEMEAIKPVLETMEKRNWTLLIAGSETGGFITIDHPVCLTNQDGLPSSFQNPVGHGTAGSALIIPISQNLLAIGTFGGKTDVVHATKIQVALLNGMVAPFAERQIYAASDQFQIFISGNTSPKSGVELAEYIASKTKAAKSEQTGSQSS